jgi:Flp pilus assembly pilin Flp
MSNLTSTLSDFARKAWIRVRHEEGQTLIEYALLAFLIAIAAIIFLSAIGLDLAETFDKVENSLGIGATNDATAGGVSDVSAKTGVN